MFVVYGLIQLLLMILECLKSKYIMGTGYTQSSKSMFHKKKTYIPYMSAMACARGCGKDVIVQVFAMPG
jgi:hypothetical protein